MSEDLDDIVENLREPSAWARVVFMLGFSLVLYMVIIPLTLLLTLTQALFSVFNGEDNDNLRHFGASLLAYISQVVRFLTFNSDERPFPFSDFPEDKGEGSVKGESEAEEAIAQTKHQTQTKPAEADSPAGSEPAAKKSVKRKSPGKKTAKKTTKKAKKKAFIKAAKPVKEQTPKSGNADEKTESDETKE
jgi:hypothetical protein